jgi:hypothetical protein
MGQSAKPTRQNRTITVDFHDETTYAEEARQNNLSISFLNVLRSALCRTQQARPLQQSFSF